MNWKNFKGTAKKLDDIDLPKIGHQIGVGEDEIHAVMDVEAAGSGFDSKGRPRILFERHHFYKHVPKDKLNRAIREGLAVKSWSRDTYGQDQYKLLERAMQIDEHSALLSCSWGLGQIMGWNHTLAGYKTVEDMVLSFMEDEENHLQAMINFIVNAGLDDELRRHDWAGFARGYNGAGYKQNRYDVKLANAFKKWQRIKDTPWNPDQPEPIEQPQIPTQEPAESVQEENGPTVPEEKKTTVREPVEEPQTISQRLIEAFIKLISDVLKGK